MSYRLILADPPWRYDFSRTNNRKIENQYPTMTVEQICSLPVRDIAAKDCALYLWAVAPKLPEALEVIRAWGFTYKTNGTWDKEKIGMGYYFRGQHEHLLVATKGRPGVPAPKTRRSSVIRSRRGKHSKKPECVHEMLEIQYPDAPRVELFARLPRAGWDVWGNEVVSTPLFASAAGAP